MAEVDGAESEGGVVGAGGVGVAGAAGTKCLRLGVGDTRFNNDLIELDEAADLADDGDAVDGDENSARGGVPLDAGDLRGFDLSRAVDEVATAVGEGYGARELGEIQVRGFLPVFRCGGVRSDAPCGEPLACLSCDGGLPVLRCRLIMLC